MSKKILVVEDNTELLELLRLGLKHAGFAVTTSSDGLDALQKVRTIWPNLVVLDLMLPELDGFAVCESLRRDRDTANIPIIVLTGLSSEFSRYAGLESGADECVRKPVTLDHLVSRIRHWLAQSKARRLAASPRGETRAPILQDATQEKNPPNG